MGRKKRGGENPWRMSIREGSDTHGQGMGNLKRGGRGGRKGKKSSIFFPKEKSNGVHIHFRRKKKKHLLLLSEGKKREGGKEVTKEITKKRGPAPVSCSSGRMSVL